MVLPPVEQFLSPLGSPRILLVHPSEEVGELLVALLLGVLYVLGVGPTALQSVVEHADQVVAAIGDARNSFAAGHYSTSSLAACLVAHRFRLSTKDRKSVV